MRLEQRLRQLERRFVAGDETARLPLYRAMLQAGRVVHLQFTGGVSVINGRGSEFDQTWDAWLLPSGNVAVGWNMGDETDMPVWVESVQSVFSHAKKNLPFIRRGPPHGFVIWLMPHGLVRELAGVLHQLGKAEDYRVQRNPFGMTTRQALTKVLGWTAAGATADLVTDRLNAMLVDPLSSKAESVIAKGAQKATSLVRSNPSRRVTLYRYVRKKAPYTGVGSYWAEDPGIASLFKRRGYTLHKETFSVRKLLDAGEHPLNFELELEDRGLDQEAWENDEAGVLGLFRKEGYDWVRRQTEAPGHGMTFVTEWIRASGDRKNPDEDIRDLERQAVAGDQVAAGRLKAAWARAGRCSECGAPETRPGANRANKSGYQVEWAKTKDGDPVCYACAGVGQLERMQAVTYGEKFGPGYVQQSQGGVVVTGGPGSPPLIYGHSSVGGSGWGRASVHWAGVDRYGRSWWGLAPGEDRATNMRLYKDTGQVTGREAWKPGIQVTRYAHPDWLKKLREAQDKWALKYGGKPFPTAFNPPRFLVRSPAQGLKTIQHPEITANYEQALRFQPKHKKAVLLPCAGTKPFPDSPSHKHGYLDALKDKKVDLFVVSEPLGVVPYSWSRRFPQAHYDFPPAHLRGEGRELLTDRIADWFERVAPKYKKVTLALPGHHKRLVNEALALLDYEPTKIVDAGLGECLSSGKCPPGNVRPTTKAYRKFLKKRVNPSQGESRLRELTREARKGDVPALRQAVAEAVRRGNHRAIYEELLPLAMELAPPYRAGEEPAPDLVNETANAYWHAKGAFNTNPGDLVPADKFLPARIPAGEYLPPEGLSFAALARGEASLVYLPEGARAKPAVSLALQSMLTSDPRQGLASPTAWDYLLAAAGRSAKIYVIDRRGEQWRVIDVEFDPGARTGQLVVRHLGRLSRSGDRWVDLREAFTYMIPVVVYDPVRRNPPTARDEVFRLLEENGAVLIRTKKHLVYALPDRQRHTVPRSPSDHRAWKNNLSHLKSKLMTMQNRGWFVRWNPEEEGQEEQIQARPPGTIRRHLSKARLALEDAVYFRKPPEEIEYLQGRVEGLQEELQESESGWSAATPGADPALVHDALLRQIHEAQRKLHNLHLDLQGAERWGTSLETADVNRRLASQEEVLTELLTRAAGLGAHVPVYRPNPIQARFGRYRQPVSVMRPAYPGRLGYWDVRFKGEDEELVVPAHDLYSGGRRWLEPPLKKTLAWK